MNAELVSTPRDRELVNLLLAGCRNSEIAADLTLTEKSVKQRLRNLYERAGILAGRKRVRLIEMLAATEQRLALPAMSTTHRRIAELAIEGLTNPEIARQVGKSEQVVKNHLMTVFDKCGVWSRTELAARFRGD